MSRKSNRSHSGNVFRTSEQTPREFPSLSLSDKTVQDSFNSNEFIQKQPTKHDDNGFSSDMNNYEHGNRDRLVEIILPPNIFDPLCLDRSSRTRVDFPPINHSSLSYSNYSVEVPKQSNDISHEYRSLPVKRNYSHRQRTHQHVPNKILVRQR
jgi:hypothetical protein